MGFFSKIFKGVKKIFKGAAKLVKNVVKKVVDVGKKIVKGVGKVVGKLGPIGTIAIGFLAPYAIGAMAGMGGWVGTIGQTLQAVGSTIAAPIKAVGQAIGAGINTMGTGLSTALGGSGSAIGQGVMSLTDKITGFLGYQGGSVVDGAKKIFGDVATQWGTIGTQSTTAIGDVATSATKQLSDVVGGDNIFSTEQAVSWDQNAASGIDLFAPKDAVTSPLTAINTEAPTNIFETGGDNIFGMQANPFDPAYSAEQLAKIDVTKTEPSLLDKVKSGLSGLSMPKLPTPMGVVSGDTQGYGLASAEAGQSGGPGSRGRSFYAQGETGLMMTEDYLQRMNSLLGRA